MKFLGIKQDDLVMVNVCVDTGWRNSTCFWVSKPVERVTPKQFIVDGVKYRKDNGWCIGSKGGDALKTGERKDQTKEMNAFIRRSNLASQARNIIRELKLDQSHKNLIPVFKKLLEIKQLLSE